MKHNWTYNGDISIRHGGFYWRQDRPDDDYVEAVDVSGSPSQDNLFYVSKDIIYMPEDKYVTALETCGYVWLPKSRQIVDCTGHAHTEVLPLLVDAFNAYWGLNDTSRVFKIQIGGPKNHPDAGYPSGPKELYDYRIAPNASLRKFIEREFL